MQGNTQSIRGRLFEVIFGSALFFIVVTVVFTQFQLNHQLNGIYDVRYVGYLDGIAKTFDALAKEKEGDMAYAQSLFEMGDGNALHLLNEHSKGAEFQKLGMIPYYGQLTESGIRYGKKHIVLPQNQFVDLQTGRFVVLSVNGHKVNDGQILFVQRLSPTDSTVVCYELPKTEVARMMASNIDLKTNVYIFDQGKNLIYTNDWYMQSQATHAEITGLYNLLHQRNVLSTVSTNAMKVMRDREGTLYKTIVPALGFQMILKVDRFEYLDVAEKTMGWTLAFACFTLICCYGVSRYFANKISAPIIDLKDAFMEAATGNFDVRAEVEGCTEMSIAGNGFNYFMEQFRSFKSEDALTGLTNYRHFLESTRELVSRFESLKESNQTLELGLMVFGIDSFKQINDSYGFEVGDELLKHTALHAAHLCANCYEVARLGGDEFACLFVSENPVQKAEQYVKDLNRILRKGIVHKHKKIYYSVSAGFCHWNVVNGTAEEMLKSAYISLNRGKTRTKGELHVLEEHEKQDFIEKVELSMHLRDALDLGELRLVAQPIHDIKTHCTKSVEFLMRWHSDKLGTVSPGKFIPIAEENGMIVPLGNWLVEEAGQTIRKYYDATGIWVCASLNVSALQLTVPGFVDGLKGVIEKYNIPPVNMIIEITERVLMDDSNAVKDILDEIHTVGCRIALDDFGTGYSSLSYLSKYKIDILKIDQSFVATMETDPHTVKLIESMIQIANNLSMQVVAEGVETKEQLERLEQLGCRYMQGYYISRPLELDTFFCSSKTPA